MAAGYGKAIRTSGVTAVDVSKIRSRKIAWGSISAWAKEFGVSRKAIRLVLDGKTWK